MALLHTTLFSAEAVIRTPFLAEWHVAIPCRVFVGTQASTLCIFGDVKCGVEVLALVIESTRSLLSPDPVSHEEGNERQHDCYI